MAGSEGIHWGGLASLLVFYALIYWLGRYAARRKSDGTAEDLMLARRSVPLWIGVFTSLAAIIPTRRLANSDPVAALRRR